MAAPTWNLPERLPRRGATGRQPSYSRDLADRILGAMLDGVGLKTAAAWCGVTFETVNAWAERCPALRQAMDQARATPLVECAQALQRYSQEPHRDAGSAVQACRFFLATHDPDNWSERTELRLSGSVASMAAVQPAPDLDAPLEGDQADADEEDTAVAG